MIITPLCTFYKYGVRAVTPLVVITLLIAFVTMSIRTVSAAMSNPADVLKED